MIKSVSKQVEEKPKFDLEEAFVLWKNVGKNGGEYLSGTVTPTKERIVAYFNSTKKNPNEPDIRVYSLTEEGKNDKEIASLWENLDKKGGKYLTGKTNYEKDNSKLVGWYAKEFVQERPYIRVYFKENN